MIPTEQMKNMRAFHGNPAIKERYRKRLKAHYKADEIGHGFYWENGRGCAVGCTIEGDDHIRYEIELGVPQAITHLEDYLFESLSNQEAKEFPVAFLEAIPVGADLSLVPASFIRWVLESTLANTEVAQDKNVYEAVKNTAELWEGVINGTLPTNEAWSASRMVAWSAALSSFRPAAKKAAESAAWSAAQHAFPLAAKNVAWSAPRLTARSAQKNKLIELLTEAPVKADILKELPEITRTLVEV